jgi:alkylation response protein AidB-like acyl-CoA dehydrogenase
MELVSVAGLLAYTVPKAYGAAGVRADTVAPVMAALSRADGSIGQIPQNHFFMLEGLRLEGSEEQKRFFYERVLTGERLGNALSETGTKTAHDHATRLSRDGSIYGLNGRKFYSTGVLFAHWVAVVANDDENVSRLVFVPRDTDGITIIDDWSGFGQRITGSGTTILKDVPVHPFSILSFSALFDRPTSMGPFAQIMHAAVEQGIAEAALADTVQFVRTSARPYKDAHVDRASDDPYTVATAGELKIRVDASSALLARGDIRRPCSGRAFGRDGRGGVRRRGGVQDRFNRSGPSRRVEADRACWLQRDPRKARARPPLAQRPHPHRARPGSMEISRGRRLLAERRQPAASRRDLRRHIAHTRDFVNTRGAVHAAEQHRRTKRMTEALDLPAPCGADRRSLVFADAWGRPVSRQRDRRTSRLARLSLADCHSRR